MQVLLPADRIQQRIGELAVQIARDYHGRPVTIVGVLTGCLMFLADLVRHLDLPLRIGLIQASSYRGAVTSPGELHISPDLQPDGARAGMCCCSTTSSTPPLVHLKKHLESVGAKRQSASACWRGKSGGKRFRCSRTIAASTSRTPSSSATVSTITTSIGICRISVSCLKRPTDFSNECGQPCETCFCSSPAWITAARRNASVCWRANCRATASECAWLCRRQRRRVEELRQAGLEVDVLGWRRPLDARPFLSLRHLLQANQPALVHVFGSTALRAARLCGVPGKSLIVSDLVRGGRPAKGWAVDRHLLDGVPRVVAFGAAEALRYQRLGITAERIVTVTPGIQVNGEPGKAPGWAPSAWYRGAD